MIIYMFFEWNEQLYLFGKDLLFDIWFDLGFNPFTHGCAPGLIGNTLAIHDPLVFKGQCPHVDLKASTMWPKQLHPLIHLHEAWPFWRDGREGETKRFTNIYKLPLKFCLCSSFMLIPHNWEFAKLHFVLHQFINLKSPKRWRAVVQCPSYIFKRCNWCTICWFCQGQAGRPGSLSGEVWVKGTV